MHLKLKLGFALSLFTLLAVHVLYAQAPVPSQRGSATQSQSPAGDANAKAPSPAGGIETLSTISADATTNPGAAGLAKELVLYCARDDYGTRVLMRAGNLAVLMRTMGHRGVKTAMHYQHPELEVVRAALDYGTPMLLKHGRSEKGVATPFESRP